MKIRSFLRPTDWSKLSATEGILSYELRKSIVFSQILILSLVGLMIHLVADLLRGDYGIVGVVILTMLVTWYTYYLNEQRRHKQARTFFFITINILFFVLASWVPRECAVNILFIALMGIALVAHPYRELKLAIVYVSISLLALIVLELTDYRPLGDSIRLLEQSSLFNSIINITSAIVILSICLLFSVHSNHRAEVLLLKRETQLMKTNEKLDRILYSASHDLRAPLHSIKGLMNLAAMDAKSDNLKYYFSLADERIAKLDQFIIDILEFSRSTKNQLAIEQVSIHELVNEIADALKYMEGASRIQLIREFSEIDFITTDRRSLSVILSNLVSNSVKYHNYQQIDPWIKIIVKREADKVCISVSDNGMGIANDQQEKVFDMFFRATDQSTGSGLGLFIVKEMVDQLNGHISLQSNLGQGSKFSFCLPQEENDRVIA
ncbi:MAG: HAMP domain-containing histidine kinase [Cyclobacteriaceae bacterium]|nr:HAMP domain-containing histidine kinase [Cyclobacteriaceae bacterium]